jgi:signal transduction histidine kinase
MLRLRTLFLLLLLVPSTARSQSVLDSLDGVLETTANDSVRFQVLIKMSQEAEYTDLSKSRDYARQGMALAERLGPWAKGKLYFRMAFLETLEGDYAEALQYDLWCANIYRLAGDSSNLARAYCDIGTDYRDLGEYADAYLYLAQSFRTARSTAHPTRRDSLTMAIALHNMGTVFTALEQFDLAYQHLAFSEKMSETIHDEQGAVYSRYEMGDLYSKKGDYDESEKHLLEASRLSKKMKIAFLLPRVRLHLATLYYHKEDFSRSLAYYDSVCKDQTIRNNRFTLAECDLGSGQVMARLGKYDDAFRLVTRSLAVANQLHASNLALSNYEALADLHEARRDFEKALTYRHQYENLRDSIFSTSALGKLFQEQVRFQTMNKDLEIEALNEVQLQQESEIRKQELIQNILVVVAVLSMFLLYTVYRSGRRRKRIHRLLLDHQEEIKRRSLELEQLNQVKDKFFSIISHDLRSPMNALGGTLDLLNKRRVSPSEFTALTQALNIQFNHTRTLINNLLDWTLLQMDKLNVQHEPVNLAEITDESFEALRNLYPKNIQLDNRIDRGLVGIGDRNILNLVLRNLILNAIKFTESGGRIWVEAEMRGPEVVVSVCDNGIGIKPEVQEFLFTKTSSYTSRGTANEKGTGLGLILCKEFVEKNGGRIWFESKPGEGSTFHFTLPKASVHEEKSLQAVAP